MIKLDLKDAVAVHPTVHKQYIFTIMLLLALLFYNSISKCCETAVV